MTTHSDYFGPLHGRDLNAEMDAYVASSVAVDAAVEAARVDALMAIARSPQRPLEDRSAAILATEGWLEAALIAFGPFIRVRDGKHVIGNQRALARAAGLLREVGLGVEPSRDEKTLRVALSSTEGAGQ